MEEIDAAVLDCCEEAFLFDLAAGEVWFDALHDLVDDAAASATASAAGANEKEAPSADSALRRAAQRPIPDVRWCTLQVVLRHACVRCRGIHNAHDMDQCIVSTLLASKPQTAAAVVQARERHVGRQLNTRELVRLVARAAPLRPDALTAVKGAFAALLKLEQKMAGAVREEVLARRTVIADEVADRHRLAAVVSQARETARQAALIEHRAASMHVLQAALQPAAAATLGAVASGRDAIPEHAFPMPSQALFDSAIAAALHDARCEADAVHEALRAASGAACSSAPLCDSVMRDVVQHVDQGERRLAALEESAAELHAMMRRLRCVRCGRRLRQFVRGRNADTQPSGEALSSTMRAASASLPEPARSLRDTLDALRACVGSAAGAARAGAARVTTEQLVQLLFDSLVHLNAEVVGSSDTAPVHGGDEHPACGTQAPRRRPALRAVTFPVFEYFCEHGEWFTVATELPARWRVYASYAAPASMAAGNAQATVYEDGNEGGRSWVWQRGMSRDGFSAFLSDLVACDAAGAAAGVRGVRLRDYLTTVVLPRWLEAPLLLESAWAAS